MCIRTYTGERTQDLDDLSRIYIRMPAYLNICHLCTHHLALIYTALATDEATALIVTIIAHVFIHAARHARHTKESHS